MHIIRSALSLLLLTAKMTCASDIPESIVAEVRATCKSPALQKLAIDRLPADLLYLRRQIEELETRQSVKMDLKSNDLRQKGKWSDDHEQRFFKALVATDAYQGAEREREKLMYSYMQATENIIDALLVGDRLANACESSVAMRFHLKWLYKISDDQWKQMLVEKDNALKQAQ